MKVFPPTYYWSTSMHLSYIKGICRGSARPHRRSYLDQQWRTQYVIGERIQYIRYMYISRDYLPIACHTLKGLQRQGVRVQRIDVLHFSLY
jgi:hypothetical protein